MFVQHILNTKNNANLITVPLKTDLSEAISILAAGKIGVVIVSETGKNALGILSERDIIRALSEVGTNALSAPVEQFMSSDVVTCSPQTSADDVLALMTKNRFRHMPVLEEGALIGLISQGDVVFARLQEISMEKDALQGMIMGH
ncbi:CBS domain-containing protein [Paracoccaceae bacterium]|nr:CBS domain-containing protein [Paracoccaceae bacterium]MED7679133.1 CBS domain-containing protein [Rhodobacteraceae bacterium IMCC15231]